MDRDGDVRWLAAPRPAGAVGLEVAGQPRWLAELLARRGVEDAASAAAFLDPRLDHLTPPGDLPRLEAAVDRLLLARSRAETVAIIADYDVDGVTAAAQLVAALRACGVGVETILPDRFTEGYGFQPEHAARAADRGCGLIVTADCGSGATAAMAAAAARAIDVIITDHHLGHSDPLDGVVEINPRRAGCRGALADLSGAGLAFKLATAFAERCGKSIEPTSLLRLACLGTIADMVPLTRENRVIAALGLRALPATRSLGLQALLRLAGATPPFTSDDVAYRIGPRLNAAGRMASAEGALELLLTRDARKAEALAADLEERNRERRAVQETVVEAAMAIFAVRQPRPPILVGWSERWHRGVVGIAAGRIARELNRPTLLFAVNDDVAVGSGRSVPGVHLFDFLAPGQERLLRFGGHAQAVGLSVAAEQLPALQAIWEQAAAAWPRALLERTLEYEASLPVEALTRETLAMVQRLEPFGTGNPQPLLRVGPLRLLGVPRLFGRAHLSAAALSPGGQPVTILGWGWGQRGGELAGDFEALGTLRLDRYRETPVFQLEATRPWSGPA